MRTLPSQLKTRLNTYTNDAGCVPCLESSVWVDSQAAAWCSRHSANPGLLDTATGMRYQ